VWSCSSSGSCCHEENAQTTCKRRGKTLKSFNDLQAKARIRPVLSHLCYIRLTAARGIGGEFSHRVITPGRRGMNSHRKFMLRFVPRKVEKVEASLRVQGVGQAPKWLQGRGGEGTCGLGARPVRQQGGVVSDFLISYISWNLISPVIKLVTFRAGPAVVAKK